jgi:hypothetical protein
MNGLFWYRDEQWPCPGCFIDLRQLSGVVFGYKPSLGDASVCPSCGTLFLCREQGLVARTARDLEPLLHPDQLSGLLERRAIHLELPIPRRDEIRRQQ